MKEKNIISQSYLMITTRVKHGVVTNYLKFSRERQFFIKREREDITRWLEGMNFIFEW